MRVLLATSFWHARGGDTTAAFAGARALQAAGHEVLPFAMRHPDNAPSTTEVDFAPWRAPLHKKGFSRLRDAFGAVWSRSAASALRRALPRMRPDVAWIHHLHRHLTPSILPVLAEAGVPVVWTLHDYELVCASGIAWRDGAPCHRCAGHAWHEAVRGRCKRGALDQSAWVALEKAAHQRAGVFGTVGRFVTPSGYLRDRLVDGGFAAHRIEVLPNIVEDPGPAEGDGDGWLLAGRLSPEKGLDVVLAADVPGLTLVGPGAPSVLPPGVRATGPRTHAETLAEIGRAAVVVVPSIWPENAPYAVLEAQLRGRAVVASAVGGIPELITHERDGLLVPPGDARALAAAIRRLLADTPLRRRLGAAARVRVGQTNAPTIVTPRLLDLFTRVGTETHTQRRDTKD